MSKKEPQTCWMCDGRGISPAGRQCPMCKGSGTLIPPTFSLTQSEWITLAHLFEKLGKPSFDVEIYDNNLSWDEMSDPIMADGRPAPSMRFLPFPDTKAEIDYRFFVSHRTLCLRFRVPVEGRSAWFNFKIKKWVECQLTFEAPEES